MISFWSGSGNENYSANSSKPVRRRSSIQAPDGTIIVLTPEEVEERLQAALNSLEVYKTKAEDLMKENQELKLRLQEVQEVLEFDDDPEKDYT